MERLLRWHLQVVFEMVLGLVLASVESDVASSGGWRVSVQDAG